MPNPTLAQIVAEPEKWESTVRVLRNGRWRFQFEALNTLHAIRYVRRQRRYQTMPGLSMAGNAYALFVRPAGSSKPFLKVEE